MPREIALRRLEEVQALQMARTLERHRARVGSEVEVLVEDRGFGRSRENWTVHFEGDASVGDLIEVRVESASLVAPMCTRMRARPSAASASRGGRRAWEYSAIA